MGVSLRSCPQGRRAAGFASLRCFAALRTVLTHALRMPHADKFLAPVLSLFNRRFVAILVCLIALLYFSCGRRKQYVPKPKCYNIIHLPEPAYQRLDTVAYPYSFEYSKHARLVPDDKERLWLSIYYPKFDATINLTYFDLTQPYKGKKATMHSIFEDHRRLIYAHTDKVTSIREKVYKVNGNKIIWFDLQGEVGTQGQFFASDSLKHVLVANMYFKTALKNDSLAPVITFVKNDLARIYQTLKWKR
ncbi:MAG: gliding motility lipoprotein GldD [Bacteroidia bacterium]|nr:gliding motility lipoprotein GldD [Bacteroidia bacterium]MDW8301542.1 gliding motility lipoprotein GldD [Bacteroidia bacterium]